MVELPDDALRCICEQLVPLVPPERKVGNTYCSPATRLLQSRGRGVKRTRRRAPAARRGRIGRIDSFFGAELVWTRYAGTLRVAPRPDAATGLLLELYRDRDTDAAARVMFREIEPQLKRLYPATFEYMDGEGNTKTLPLFGELVEAAFY